MFIELTDITKSEGIRICHVNINKIITYTDDEGSATLIKFEGGGYMIVSESSEEVKTLIEKAERGY